MFLPRLRGFSLVTLVSSHSPNACILGLADLTGDSKVVGGVNVSLAKWPSPHGFSSFNNQ